MVDIVPLETRRVRVERCVRWGGLVVGGVVAWRSAAVGGLGVGFLYGAAGFGLCAVGGVLVGDALTPRPGGAVRTAGLVPRRVRDQVSVRVAGLLVAEAVALLVLLAAAAAVASPDDMGRAGRALTVACGGVTESRSPWPGGFYGIPAVVSLAAATAACGWALRRIAQRPGGEGERRTRSSAIVAAWGALVSAQLSGVGFTAAAALRGTACVGTAGAVAGWVLWPLGLLAVVTFAWCLSAVAGRR